LTSIRGQNASGPPVSCRAAGVDCFLHFTHPVREKQFHFMKSMK
jgi:hypothetical protein